jgi:hypothetical protein
MVNTSWRERKCEWEAIRLQQLRIRLQQEEEEERIGKRVETIQLQEGIHRHQQPEAPLQLGEEHRRQNTRMAIPFHRIRAAARCIKLLAIQSKIEAAIRLRMPFVFYPR